METDLVDTKHFRQALLRHCNHAKPNQRTRVIVQERHTGHILQILEGQTHAFIRSRGRLTALVSHVWEDAQANNHDVALEYATHANDS